MTDDEIELLRTLPESWQVAILEREVQTLAQALKNRPPPPAPVQCLTPLLADVERLERLRALLAEVSRPDYRRQEIAPEKGWLHRLLG